MGTVLDHRPDSARNGTHANDGVHDSIELGLIYTNTTFASSPIPETCSIHPPGLTAFTQLAIELQLLISKDVVTRPEPIDMSRRTNHRLPDITLISKLIHAEGSRAYYRENTFLIPLPSQFTSEEGFFLDQWLCHSLATKTIAKMGRIVVQIYSHPIERVLKICYC